MATAYKSGTKSRAKRRSRGFMQTGGLLKTSIRRASETRGFAETRLLTQWAEVAGQAVAKIAQPVKISYAQKGMGASLTLLCAGANAPMLQMQLPQIIKRVNACYGYNAISRITLTQTAPSGFAEAQTKFDRTPAKTLSSDEALAIESSVKGVESDGLRQALATLGTNITARHKAERSKKD